MASRKAKKNKEDDIKSAEQGAAAGEQEGETLPDAAAEDAGDELGEGLAQSEDNEGKTDEHGVLAENGDDEQQASTELQADAEDDAIHRLLADNFIEYASYVVKERAIPDVDDGLKPVQRRILYCLHRVDDGRYHKVAGIIGDTMHFHPHGDQSIGDALTVLANKEYFIDRQGNFGNILTGDGAAAARYIECRLTPLAREVLFNQEITEFSDSYDGRSQEPVRLPCKVPALLMLGSDGIAVGMMTRIFPHNFCELLEAQIAILEDRPFQLYPDFQQCGIMDVSEYEDGAGRIRLRARIEADGDKKVIIKEVPATTTTESLMASIERAAKSNRIKISSINDYTAKEVAIEISLPRGVYAEDFIRELYAYTDCEVTVNSTLRVICENVPVEMTVSEVLRRNTEKLQGYLRRELELERQKQEELFHEKTLAQIFIENRIYKRIEKCETLPLVMSETRAGLERFRAQLRRDISDADIEKLLQIAIRRISMFDIRKNEQELAALLEDMAATEANLAKMVDYTIAYIRRLLEKYGADFPRRTQIASFAPVDLRKIARRDLRVHHDRLEHFIGTQVKSSNKDSAPLVCTEFDRLMLLRNDGTCRIIAVPEKEYIGPTKYVMLWDKEQVYCILYRDRQEGSWFVKRFSIERFTLGREYQIVPPNCLIENLYTNSGVQVILELEPNNRRSYHSVEVDFDQYALRSRSARGFKLTQYPVSAVTVVKRGSPAKKQEDEQDPEDEEGNDVELQPIDRELEKKAKNTPAKQDDAAKKTAVSGNDAKKKTPAPVKKDQDQTPKESGKDEQEVKKSAAETAKEKKSAAAVDKSEEEEQQGAAAEAKEKKSAAAVDKGEEEKQSAAAEGEEKKASAAGDPVSAELKEPPDSAAVRNGAAKGMSRLRKLIDEDTPFFLEE
jgi:topoisomerase-4 subunit A